MKTALSMFVALFLFLPLHAEAALTDVTLPIGTRIAFHVNEPLSANKTKTGEQFQFALTEALKYHDQVIIPAGQIGNGTVLLAGHSSMGGHEGDLTLRLDWIQTNDGRFVAFNNQQVKINGKKRSGEVSFLRLIPYVGMGANLMNGSNSEIDQNRVISTTLTQEAKVVQLDLPVAAAATTVP